VIKLRHHADDRTNRRSFLNFCEISWMYQNSAEKGKFRCSAQNSVARGKLWALEIR